MHKVVNVRLSKFHNKSLGQDDPNSTASASLFMQLRCAASNLFASSAAELASAVDELAEFDDLVLTCFDTFHSLRAFPLGASTVTQGPGPHVFFIWL